jgi:hypothetical protein
VFVSTQDNLVDLSVDKVLTGESSAVRFTSEDNDDQVRIVGYKSITQEVLAVNAYSGNVLVLDKEDFSVNVQQSGFDGPFKVRWSEYHDKYIVASSHAIWLTDLVETPEVVYQVGSSWVVDMDISEHGDICLIVSDGSTDSVRILKSDFYSFSFSKDFGSGHSIKFCQYCNNRRFYVSDELETESTEYSSDNYVFDVANNTSSVIKFDSGLSTTTTTTTLAGTSDAISINTPNGGELLEIGEIYEITWTSSKGVVDPIKIDLYKGGYFETEIVGITTNTGLYSWTIPEDIEEGSDYRIRVTWNSTTPEFDESSADFTILETVPATTTTTTTKPYSQYIVGVGYDKDNDLVIFTLFSGLFGVLDLGDLQVYGLLDSGKTKISAMGIGDDKIADFGVQTQVRIFVGSEVNWSDKWDSGSVETRLTSMYYGGGNNLTPGQTYYAHIQTYSEKSGWGSVSVQEFVIPK